MQKGNKNRRARELVIKLFRPHTTTTRTSSVSAAIDRESKDRQADLSECRRFRAGEKQYIYWHPVNKHV